MGPRQLTWALYFWVTHGGLIRPHVDSTGFLTASTIYFAYPRSRQLSGARWPHGS